VAEPALSFRNQPALKTLLQCMRAKQGMNLILGAGVSISSGLPSWPGLLERMTRTILDDTLREAILKDPVDAFRKADIITLAKGGGRKDAMRRALYPDEHEPTPGTLATALARLILSSPERFRLITTNFDCVMELALKQAFGEDLNVPVFTLDSADHWKAMSPSELRIPVLHLHGYLALEDADHKEPIVLGESEFRKHGGQARQVLIESLRQRPSLFVGVSLADPNLVGPLADVIAPSSASKVSNPSRVLRDLPHPAFILSPPDPIPGLDHLARLEYSKTKAHHLEQNFGVKVLNLNSFGQVSQVVREMLMVGSLDATSAKKYFDGGSRSGGRYGHRFNRLMRSAYSAIGSPRGVVTPTTLDRMQKSLHRALERSVLPCLWRELQQFSDREIRAGQGDPLEQVKDEHFNLVLWLRTLPADKATRPAYALQTVGCSAFAHADTWSYNNRQHIRPDSGYPAVEAVYHDEAQLVDLTGAAIPLWPTLYAVPILANDDWDSDLCIGAITLGSHSFLNQETHDANPSKHRNALSILRLLDVHSTVAANVSQTLQEVAATALKKSEAS
jgi:hypothetical protein